MEFQGIKSWGEGFDEQLIIAGPCSAESEEQLFETAAAIKKKGVNIIRAGIWKPRTRPGTFEGHGVTALPWLTKVKKELGLKVAIEVATSAHVEAALKHDVDLLWIGARSTVNPFAVQDIADAMRGVDDVPVLVKNPINPDLALWKGGLERFYRVGVRKLGAIHRGFSTHEKTDFRNPPMWQIPIELKREFPEIPLICDPSHICGKRETLFEVSQKALDMNFDGLIIESHRDPSVALSDAKQQVTPLRLEEILTNLVWKRESSSDALFINKLEELRNSIDDADAKILKAIANRMDVVEEIGDYKREKEITTFQVNRWNEIYKTRKETGAKLGLHADFVGEVYKLIHEASIRRQTEVMLQKSEK